MERQPTTFTHTSFWLSLSLCVVVCCLVRKILLKHTTHNISRCFVMFALMIMSTGTNIIHIFIKITHVIRLTFRKREEDAFDEDTLSFQFNSIQFGRHICLHTFAFPHSSLSRCVFVRRFKLA